MLEAVVFYFVSALTLAFGVLVITARNTVHSVLFLVANFLCVAVLYVALGAEFLAVIQVLVYAGGIVVLYLFVVMLVNLKAIPEARMDPRRRSRLGFALAAALLAEVSAILVYAGQRAEAVPQLAPAADVPVRGNSEVIGWLLYSDFLVPFEVASVLLLVAMIGAILLARKEA
jgi:NADH-quinone oxidoreductase subunit J